MTEDDSSDEASPDEPKRYPLQWSEGMRPDEEDMLVETVGSDD